MKTKINIIDPEKQGKENNRKVACLNVKTNRAKLSDGREYSLKYLESIDKNGVVYFETHQNGNLIQKIGKFLKQCTMVGGKIVIIDKPL